VFSEMIRLVFGLTLLTYFLLNSHMPEATLESNGRGPHHSGETKIAQPARTHLSCSLDLHGILS
jgi:hypothetical protein